MDPFSGNTDTSFTYWLNKYEKFCDLNNITEADRFNVMPFYLTSSALIYYNELPQHIKSNYTALKDALKEKFESDSRYIDFSILSAKQESSESVESYLNRICKLASDKNVPERLLISICLNGLKPSLRKSVFLSQPKHFSELTKLARLAETSEKGLMNSIESSYEIFIDQIKNLKTQVSAQKQEKTVNELEEVNRYQNMFPLNNVQYNSQATGQYNSQSNPMQIEGSYYPTIYIKAWQIISLIPDLIILTMHDK